jgi:hypothetical protein
MLFCCIDKKIKTCIISKIIKLGEINLTKKDLFKKIIIRIIIDKVEIIYFSPNGGVSIS